MKHKSTKAVLTMKAMRPSIDALDRDRIKHLAQSHTCSECSAALALPFPERPNSTLLAEARDQIIHHLLWITVHEIHAEDDWLRYEITRAAVRLTEIVPLLSYALEAEMEADLEREMKRNPQLRAAQSAAKARLSR